MQIQLHRTSKSERTIINSRIDSEAVPSSCGGRELVDIGVTSLNISLYF